MTAFACWIERVWHGPRTKRRNATHHRPAPTTHACVTTRRPQMSQFSGSQFKGAMRERRATKKAEAVERNVSPRVGCTHPGHSHNANGSARCPE